MLPRSLEDFINWYFAPWLRIDRTVFNVTLLIATLPGLVLGLGSMAGFMSPLADMMTMSQQLSGSTDPSSLNNFSDSLEMMHNLSSGLDAHGQKIAGTNWADWVNLLIMVALTPIFAARARDIGVRRAWVPTTLAQGTLITDFVKLLGFALPFSWVAGITSFIVVLWLCVKKSKPRPPKFPVDETVNPNNWPPAPYA